MARSHPERIEKSVKIGILEVLEQAGLTDKRLAAFLEEVMAATKVVGYIHQYKKGDNGKIERIGPDEAISNEFIEVPDFYIRIKAAELALKMRGHLKEKIEHSGEIKGPQPLIIAIPSERQKEYDNRIAGIRPF